MSMVQAVKFTPTTTPTVLGLSISWKISLQRFCFAKSNFYSGQNIMKMWSEVNLGHEGDAERKGGADHKGLKKLQSAGKTHLHNVGKQIDWSKLWTDPGSMDQFKKMVIQHFDINLCLGWSPVGAISSVPEPCFEKPSGSLQGKRCTIIFNSWEKCLFLRDEDSDLISGSTGSGGLTTGDDEPSLCCSTDDGPSVCQSKYWKLYCGKFYPFVAQEKDQVV